MGYLNNRKKLTKAKLGDLVFQFNPETITYTMGAEFSQTRGAGMHYPLFSYTGGKPINISFEIYLNDLGERTNGLTTETFCKTIESYSRYGKSTPTEPGSYKPLLFVFGSKVYKCVISELSIEYLAFNKKLTPIEAKIQVTLSLLS